MRARSVIHALIAVLALVCSEPFHQWMHGGVGATPSEHQELHDGSCEHFAEQHGDDNCLLSTKVQGPTVALVNTAHEGELAATALAVPDAPSGLASDPLVGLLGARAPPVIG